MSDYPAAIAPVGHVEPVPRRVRAVLDARTVIDTTAARYVWEWPFYPQYQLPVADVSASVASLAVSETDGYLRFDWDVMDAWFEEDEQVFVHPRNPYTRVDALRSSRSVRVELDGVVLADADHGVFVFETGLPTRYYVERAFVNFEHLTPSGTRTPCPYKGRTSAYWSAPSAADIAWSYDFPTRELLPIAGLVAFYNEKVDITVDGVRLARPTTHFS